MRHSFDVINVKSILLRSKRQGKEGSTFISREQVDANFQDYITKLKDRATKDKKIIIENEIMAKIMYIHVMCAIEEIYKMAEYAEEVKKEPIGEQAIKSSKKARAEAEREKKKNAENSRRNNEYRQLKLPERAPASEVSKKYLQELTNINSFLDSKISLGTFTQETADEAEKALIQKAEAYELLSDPKYKAGLDEILLLNFDPNQEALYIPKNMAEVTYLIEPKHQHIDEKTRESYLYQPSVVFNTDEAEIVIEHIGNLGFGRFRQADGKVTYRDPRKLKDYRVVKKYSNSKLATARKEAATRKDSLSYWDAELGAEVFFVCGELNEGLLGDKNVDKSLLAYTAYVTLSNTNLEQALEHNGGYIGEVTTNPEGEYVTYHDRDALCVAKEYEKVRKSDALKLMHKIKFKTEEEKGIIYQVDTGDLLISMQDKRDNERRIYKSRLDGFPVCINNRGRNVSDEGGR